VAGELKMLDLLKFSGKFKKTNFSKDFKFFLTISDFLKFYRIFGNFPFFVENLPFFELLLIFKNLENV